MTTPFFLDAQAYHLENILFSFFSLISICNFSAKSIHAIFIINLKYDCFSLSPLLPTTVIIWTTTIATWLVSCDPTLPFFDILSKLWLTCWRYKSDYERPSQKPQNLFIKKLYLVLHVNLQSPSNYSPFDLIYLLRHFCHYSKQFLN